MKRATWVVGLVIAPLLASSCTSTPKKAVATNKFVLRTDAASKPVRALTWNLGYEPTSLDPVKAADYSENQVLANLCESLQKIQPDLTFANGLAKATNPQPTRWVYDIVPQAHFWDGHPVMAEDVAYSLNRNLDPKLGSYYSFYYRNVAKIVATGARQVTVTLKKPDYVFNEGMGSAAGAIVERADAVKRGVSLGTPNGGLMCSGPFELGGWKPGTSLLITQNSSYWRPQGKAKAGSITFSFLSDDTAQTNAFTSGSINGEYQVPFSAVDRLKSTSSGKLYLGQSLIVYNLVVAAKDGPLANPKVRQALSRAIDRDAIARTVFSGAAVPARNLVTKASYGYGKEVFGKGYEKAGPIPFDPAGAKKLLKGIPLRTIVFAYPTGGPSYNNQVALAVQSAGKSIGLQVVLKGVPNAKYQSDFFAPEVTKGVDLEELSWYIDGPEPLVMYEQFLPGLSPYNVSGYNNPAANDLINEAAATAEPNARAALVVEVEKQIAKDLPWIPVVEEANTLFVDKKYGGMPAAFVQNAYPWGADVAGR